MLKKQIKRLSPHQNGKVFGVLMAVSSLILFLPMSLMMSVMGPQVDRFGNEVVFPTSLFLLMPLFYLVFGYISVAIGCAIYNFLFKYIGGIEFESVEERV
jgi:hypothetical protein